VALYEKRVNCDPFEPSLHRMRLLTLCRMAGRKVIETSSVLVILDTTVRYTPDSAPHSFNSFPPPAPKSRREKTVWLPTGIE